MEGSVEVGKLVLKTRLGLKTQGGGTSTFCHGDTVMVTSGPVKPY